ncbi:heparan-sulfate 6-o-sulfotransferase 2-like [Plakobranchus ocellatus]|uniref:Heparan-sulfate 6-O-sulfotransferase n=1 Tax=Plakobranchus ocellatus TaxID=259542 RepID=A0AAV3YT40_9GAST|nr:heparan-sulfate 6-o-sulfotransferase 2-like [Plakobranchus ocellatus]
MMSLVILALGVGAYWHASSKRSAEDKRSMEQLAQDSGLSLENVAFWRPLGLRLADTIFLKADREGIPLNDVQAYRSNLLVRRSLPREDVQFPTFNFNYNKSDVLVLLHIQKTGGSNWENHMALNLMTDPPPKCRAMPDAPHRLMCSCVNGKGQDWMFNKNCVGWPCGVHPGFMELTSCLDRWYDAQVKEDRQRRYHFMTLIRDPVTRFYSEWLHIRRGATWKECRLHCDGRDATLEEVPWCFDGGNWRGASLEEFLSCRGNMGFNRMTYMLANLSLSDCYRLNSNKTREQRDEIMLESAKSNLARYVHFFGLTEYIKETQALFEKTFLGLKFKKQMELKQTQTGSGYVMMSDYIWNRLLDMNHLDVRLYQYAKDLFFQRLEAAGIRRSRPQHEAKVVSETFTYTVVDV